VAENLLLVEDEDTLRESLARVFVREGYDVDAVADAEASLKAINERTYGLILTDIMLPGIDGIELLKKVKEISPDQLIIVMTAFASLDTAIEALRGGAYDYIIKPVIHEEVKRIVKNAFREMALKSENRLLKKQIEDRYNFEQIIGESPAIKSLIAEVKKIADSKSNVIILGETGHLSLLTAAPYRKRFLSQSSLGMSKVPLPVQHRQRGGSLRKRMAGRYF